MAELQSAMTSEAVGAAIADCANDATGGVEFLTQQVD